MKRMLVIIIGFALLLSACASPAQPSAPTETVAPPTTMPTEPPAPTLSPEDRPIPVDIPAAERLSIEQLAQSLGIPVDQIKLVSIEEVQWPDSCLGVQHPGIMCAQVVTPGWKVVLEANGRQYEFHTNQDGSQIVSATLGFSWHREGGVAGFNDDLQIYLPAGVFTSNKAGEAQEADLLQAASETDFQQLQDWLGRFGDVSITVKDPASADAMTQTLTLHGFGTAQPTEAEQQAMLAWAQNLFNIVQQSTK